MDGKVKTARSRLTWLAGSIASVAAAVCLAPAAASTACIGSCPVSLPTPPHPTLAITGSEPNQPEPAWAQARGAPPFLPPLTATYGDARQTATDYFNPALTDEAGYPGGTPTATFTASASDDQVALQITRSARCSVPSPLKPATPAMRPTPPTTTPRWRASVNGA